MNIKDKLGASVSFLDPSKLQIGDIIAEHNEGHPISEGIAFVLAIGLFISYSPEKAISDVRG